jgi:hypothetical protein
MNFLAPETSHIMALKIKDYIIFSLLLARHYLQLIFDDHSYSVRAPELIALIWAKLLSISSYITIKMYFCYCIQRGGFACGEVSET